MFTWIPEESSAWTSKLEPGVCYALPICMCNMYCASPRIFKDARATKNYDGLECLWVASGFPIRISTDAPRRVKAATREGHPAPWLAAELDPRGAQSEETPGFSFIWSCSVRYSRSRLRAPPERATASRSFDTREQVSHGGTGHARREGPSGAF